jgi:predicted MPP superfamily phosphohydrolase
MEQSSVSTITTEAVRSPALDLEAAPEYLDTTPLAGLITLPAHQPHRNPLDPARLTYTKSWFGAAAAAGALGLAGLGVLGWPVAAAAGVLGAAGLAYMKRVEPMHPILEHVTLRLRRLPPALEGLRIGHITDIHLGLPQTTENMEWAIAAMERERPDAIAITGDIVGLREGIAEIPRLLGRLHAPLGVYAVPGNHDYWEGLRDVEAGLSLAGVQLMLNRNQRLGWNGADFWVAGVDDIWDGRPNFTAARYGVPDDGFVVLLAHSPDIADNAAEHSFDVQISGHSHGGHLRLPLLGPFAKPRFGVRYVMGHYTVGEMPLYVSRGLGGVPMRFLCPPEATIFTLRCA